MILHQILTKLRSSLHFACAGAGAEFIHQLWKTPGSSRYLMGCSLIQSRSEIDRFIGYTPDGSYCSKDVSIDLAIAAFLHACRHPGADNPIGIAATAAVATDRLPRGEQRAHLALIDSGGVFYRCLSLEKAQGADARRAHDTLIARALRELLISATRGEATYRDDRSGLDQMLKRPCFLSDGTRRRDPPDDAMFFPANFNPAHDGHWETCKEAEKASGGTVQLMIEANPPNKSPIPLPEILRRIANLPSLHRPIIITCGLGTYLEKARAYPGSSFVVGADVVTRILEPAWGYDVEPMLAELDSLGTQLLVRGRQLDGKLTTLHNIAIPADYGHLFETLEGYSTLSSTQLRAAAESKADTNH